MQPDNDSTNEVPTDEPTIVPAIAAAEEPHPVLDHNARKRPLDINNPNRHRMEATDETLARSPLVKGALPVKDATDDV